MYSILRWNQILCSTSSSLSATTEISVQPNCQLRFFDKTAPRFKPRPGGARRECGLFFWGPTVRVTSCHIAVLGDELSGTSCHEASCRGRVDIVPKFVSETSKPWSQHTSTIEAKVGGNFGHRRAKKRSGSNEEFRRSQDNPDFSQFLDSPRPVPICPSPSRKIGEASLTFRGQLGFPTPKQSRGREGLPDSSRPWLLCKEWKDRGSKRRKARRQNLRLKQNFCVKPKIWKALVFAENQTRDHSQRKRARYVYATTLVKKKMPRKILKLRHKKHEH